MLLVCFCRKLVSEVGFEPTPTFVDQNTPVRKSSTLESGALDRSAILTVVFSERCFLSKIQLETRIDALKHFMI